MTVTQYIGARYVPLFADPLDWDIQKEYEPLTIVYWQGNSYTSRQAVPKGIDVSNEEYWALTGNYNAQIEQYRREVAAYDGRITDNAAAIAKEVQDRMAQDNELAARLASTEGTLSALGTAANKNWTGTLNDSTDLIASNAVNSALKTANSNIGTVSATANANKDMLSKMARRGHTLIVIGDSFSTTSGSPASEAPLWHTRVAQRLGLTVDNRAVAGRGFTTVAGNSFNEQAQAVVNDYKSKQDEIYDIVVFGGWNDINQNPTSDTMTSAVSTCFNTIRDGLPNAPVTIMGCNTFVDNRIRSNISARRITQIMARQSAARGFRFIDMHLLNIGDSNYFKDDGHPNALGEASFAAAYMGTSDDLINYPYSVANLTDCLENCNGTFNAYIRQNHLKCYINITSASGTPRIHIPYGLETLGNIPVMCMKNGNDDTPIPLYIEQASASNNWQTTFTFPTYRTLTYPIRGIIDVFV